MAEADPNRAKLYQGIVNRSNKRRQSATIYAQGVNPKAAEPVEDYSPTPLGLGLG
jgi:hypothetical protein